jgi:CHAT domain-containing protein/tetratricopeptide (TPR) repeat protein
VGDTHQESRAITALGFVRISQGSYPAALALMEQALKISRADQDTVNITLGLQEVGSVLFEMGHLREARARLAECLHVIEASSHPQVEGTAIALNALGCIEAALGEFEPARHHLERALDVCRSEEQLERWTMPEFMIDLAQLRRRLGDFDGAQALIEEGLRGARHAHQKLVEVRLLNERAELLYALGDLEPALRTARQAEGLGRDVSPRYLWRAGQIEAASLARLGRLPEAITVLDSTVASLAASPDSTQLMGALLLQGAFQLRAGKHDRAELLCQRSFTIARALANPALIADARLTLGAAQVAAGRPGEGAETLELGLKWFEGVQSAVKASEERGAYQAQWYDAYVWLARGYARQGKAPLAWATLERSRAREARRLAAAGSRPQPRIPLWLRRETEAVESALNQTQASLLYAYGLPAARRPTNLAQVEGQVDSLRAVRAALGRRLQREAPGYARETGQAPPISLLELRRRIGPRDRLIAYMVGADGSVLFDVGADRLRVHELPLTEDSLGQRVRHALEEVRTPRSRDDRGGSLLADDLLGPCRLAEALPRRLYLLPDGPLHYLPFEALRTPGRSGGAQPYLIEQTEVVYGLSATLLFQSPTAGTPAPSRGRAPLVAFGDPGREAMPAVLAHVDSPRGMVPALTPLPFARREVLALPGLFPGARTYVGDQATESRFFAEFSRTPILHVAAHAFVDDRRPEFSGIVLAPSPGRGGAAPDDGLVQGFEVMERSVDLDLATLSACETGRGTLLRGEGLLGLARAFRLAGARNLVVSLWKVDDAATCDFMGEFYARLSRGASPAAALRGAKLAFLAGSRTKGAPLAATTKRGEEEGGPTRAEGDQALEAAATEADSVAGAARGVGASRAESRRAAPAAWAAFVLLGSEP